MFFGMFRSVHTMNLPRLATQGILVYPLSGYHNGEAPMSGPICEPAVRLAARGCQT
jgi:hypothetical protein